MKVSRDDYSQYMEKKHVPNDQPVEVVKLIRWLGKGRWVGVCRLCRCLSATINETPTYNFIELYNK